MPLRVEAGTPARIDSKHVAKLLGVSAHDIPVLVRARLLKPLGNPAPNSPKYFAACIIVNLANDPDWLDRATRAVAQFWKQKNARRANLHQTVTS